MSDNFIWNDELSYFKRTEKWGNPMKMNGALLLVLDNLRYLIDAPFIIHRGYDLISSERSQHRLGNAVDFYISGMEFLHAYKKLTKALINLQVDNFVGLGVYPQWNNPGFHLDTRGTRARWGRWNNEYIGLERTIKLTKEAIQ